MGVDVEAVRRGSRWPLRGTRAYGHSSPTPRHTTFNIEETFSSPTFTGSLRRQQVQYNVLVATKTKYIAKHNTSTSCSSILGGQAFQAITTQVIVYTGEATSIRSPTTFHRRACDGPPRGPECQTTLSTGKT